MKIRTLSRILSAAAVSLALATVAQAQATRTWVSGVGDDVNPCSRTAPCKTWAGAISKTAPGGEIDALDPGGFGTVTITKSITLDGGYNFGSTLASGTTGILVNAGATDTVNIKRISINGANGGLFGVRVLQAKQVNIEYCEIFGFTGSPGRGVSVEPTTATSVSAFNIYRTVIEHNAGSGVALFPPGGIFPTRVDVNIAESKISDNANAGVSSGVFIGEGGKASISQCEITRNDFAGVDAGGSTSPSLVVVTNSNVSNNGIGVHTGGAGVIRIGGNNIGNNVNSSFNVGGGQIQTHGNNQIQGAGVGVLTAISPLFQ
jgi:hypothetical protein